jgi:ribonuclease HI
MTPLRLYTDGSAAGGVGAWAWILVGEHVVASRSGVLAGPSTHQAAELTAAIEGLAWVVASGFEEVELISDSRYLVDGMSLNGGPGWAHGAAVRGWRSKRGRPLAYRQLWQRILELDGCLDATWRHVLGHRPKKDTSDDARYNREADALAGEARRSVGVAPAAPDSA